MTSSVTKVPTAEPSALVTVLVLFALLRTVPELLMVTFCVVPFQWATKVYELFSTKPVLVVVPSM